MACCTRQYGQSCWNCGNYVGYFGGKKEDEKADRNTDSETRLMKYQRETKILWKILLEFI